VPEPPAHLDQAEDGRPAPARRAVADGEYKTASIPTFNRVRRIETPCRGRQAPFTGPGAGAATSVPLTAFTRAGTTRSPRRASRRNAGFRRRESRPGFATHPSGATVIADPLEQDGRREVRPAVLGAEQPDLRIAQLQVDGLPGEPGPLGRATARAADDDDGAPGPPSWRFLRSGPIGLG
jgi:hypothetical protein